MIAPFVWTVGRDESRPYQGVLMPLFMLDGAGICRVGIAQLFAYLAGMNLWAVPTLRGYLHDIGHANRCDACVGHGSSRPVIKKYIVTLIRTQGAIRSMTLEAVLDTNEPIADSKLLPISVKMPMINSLFYVWLAQFNFWCRCWNFLLVLRLFNHSLDF